MCGYYGVDWGYSVSVGDCDECGMVSVVCATSTEKDYDYAKEYYEVLESMGDEREGNETAGKALDAGDYDRTYAVEFQDYTIFYLINEDNKTIAIFTSEEPQTEFVSEYSGDLDEGMDSDWNDLEMKAHLKSQTMLLGL